MKLKNHPKTAQNRQKNTTKQCSQKSLENSFSKPNKDRET